ncbi:MAG TPA: DUF6152 family protein [Gammaproteobacteria bacterium]
MTKLPEARNSLSILVFAASAFISTHALAHHSTVANPALYLAENLVELEGEITEVLWRNPHARVRLRVVDDAGEEKTWELEFGPAGVMSLERRGITADTFRPGDRVTAAGFVSRWSRDSLGLLHLLLPDGREYIDGNREPRWSNVRLGSEARPIDAARVEAARREAEGIFRVWGANPDRRGPPHPRPSTYDYLLTERGRELAATFDPPTDHPELDCRQGMPTTMFDPVPMQLIDAGDRILLRVEEYDIERVIYLDPGAANLDVAASPLGHSVGRWEGDTLIVETDRVEWPYFDPYGTPQSEQTRYIETFSIAEEGNRLNYVFTAIDPEMFSEPVVIEWPRSWTPGVELQQFDCVADWEDAAD